MTDNRDALDYGEMHVPQLFRRLFFPTLVGLVSIAVLYIADGIFVGQGVGSDALAAINIASPVFKISTGIAIMFGSGVSVVAAIHLSKGNVKAANINITQAFTIGLLFMGIIVLLLNLFPHQTVRIFGGSDKLYTIVHQYLAGISVCLMCTVVNTVGLFVIRLDGSPKFAMAVNATSASLNIFLDWLFVFPLHAGILGAAIATSIASAIGSVLVVIYFLKYNHRIHLYRPKFSKTALRLTSRNCSYMTRLGLPTFISETALSCLMIAGNFAFMHYLHEDGVAAFSVACYVCPMIFMFGNAIAESSLPIVSYNYGLGRQKRISQTLRLSLWLACGLGFGMTVIGILLAPQIADLFIPKSSPANTIAAAGMPYFLLTCFPATLNLVFIGYLQSLEHYRPATMFTLPRGYLLIAPAFILLPFFMGTKGLWLAQPVCEAITFASMLCFMLFHKYGKERLHMT